MKKIYVVITLKIKDIDLPAFKITEKFICGWFRKNKDARKAVEENWGDIHEDSLNYALIEERFEGIYFDKVPKELWFKWDKEKESYQEIEKPEQLKQICSFMS